MKFSDIKRFFGGANSDDDPIQLPDGDYSPNVMNIRTGSSTSQNEIGHVETLQSEIEIVLGVTAPITYYGESIGGEFVYSGYSEVVIGTQTWMKKNWDYNYPGSKVYDDDETNRAIYGGLYTWNQIMASDFCPAGWHVPTEAEWDVLLTYLGGEIIAGGKLKEPDTTHWDTPNTGADDSSGFKGLPGGKFDDAYSLLGAYGLFWVAGEGYPWAPVALPATDISPLTFMAHWEASNGATGYWLDVATDIAFTAFVAGYQNKDVGNVLQDTISGLNPEITYYYRVRASNEIDTSLSSNIITTKTSAVVIPLLDKDGNIYTTIIVGTQEWIVQNLKVTKYADGSPIFNAITAAEWIGGGTGLPIATMFGSTIVTYSSAEVVIAQGFIVPECNVSSIKLHIEGKSGSPNFDIRLSIYEVVGNLPTNKLYDSTNVIHTTDVLGAEIVFNFANVHLDAGSYCFVTSYENIVLHNVGNCLNLSNNNVNEYTDGKLAYRVGVVWFVSDIFDSWATIYYVPVGNYCWYDNDIANKADYGALYNWHAVDNVKELAYLERGGIQESGWRVPTKEEWQDFVDVAGGDAIAAAALKEVANTHWAAPNNGAVDIYGFKALPGGIRFHIGLFSGITTAGAWWTSDANGALEAWFCEMSNVATNVGSDSNEKAYGKSVRLVKDLSGKGGNPSFDSIFYTFDSTIETFDES